jgi:membrane protein required for colicin V production
VTLDLGWVDLFMLVVMAASVVIGLWRGFIFEVLALLGWIAAYFFSQWFAPDLSRQLPIGTPGSGLNHAAAFVLCFIFALIVWGLLARVVRLLLRATPLSVPDRVLGAGFGVLRGGVLLLVLATIVAFTPAARSPEWQASIGARWLGDAVVTLRPALPAEVANWLPAPGR